MLTLSALTAILLAALAVVVWPSTEPRSHVPAALQHPLDAKVAAVSTQLDQASACEYASATQCVYTCTAHTFDLDPQDATTIDQVAIAYATLDCHTSDSTGVIYAGSDVLALRFTSPPTRSDLPDDATWADVVKIFPPHSAGAAWWYYTDGTLTLRDRLHRFAAL